ncbi:MAG: M20/M25/M40 family metallo-hydrolase [Planctomycetaceae bacterium]|nr:M20/M25/M40 family metallo-hydrolase [Planctomycetaceae bacterium]
MSETTNTNLPKVSRKVALDRVKKMMSIPGKSCHEKEIVEFITEELKDAGVPQSAIQVDSTPKVSPAGGEVGNLIVKLKGTKKGPRRLLMAHIDTVPLCVGSRPVQKGDVIVARDPQTALGADNRAGASVVLTAILEILRQDLPYPPLTLFWPVQEEIGLLGARHVSLSKLGNPQLCFNWDGSFPEAITIGATGDYAIHIEIEGLASHAGVHPERGVNAIAIAGRAIADLVENGWHGLIVKGKNRGTSNIGFVEAGEATNVVTPRLVLRAEARSHDPKFRSKIVKEYQAAFERAAKAIKNDEGKTGRVNFSADLKYESFQIPESEPVVQVAIAATEAVGLTPETKISNGGLDANWLSARGLPTVTMGCGQQNVHTVDEALHIESYLHACQVGLVLATDCLG